MREVVWVTSVDQNSESAARPCRANGERKNCKDDIGRTGGRRKV